MTAGREESGVVLLALGFPLLIVAFLLLMEALEAALLPTPPLARPAAADVRDEGDDLVGGVPAVPSPRGPATVPDDLRLDLGILPTAVRRRTEDVARGVQHPERQISPGGG